ncbi:hypothetical protein HDU87_000386 [Geranomyces variabilis]|uniref:Uncharacterized protein n=1 Tax=Geranomyces variabilis TaxID=109894 RepID=A0AAD5TNI6_9FUNG|nr:hypothetical protein HDU87_000386 [Geranomyces variabilis]
MTSARSNLGTHDKTAAATDPPNNTPIPPITNGSDALPTATDDTVASMALLVQQVMDPAVRQLLDALTADISKQNGNIAALTADIEALAPETVLSAAAEIVRWMSGSEPGDAPVPQTSRKLQGGWLMTLKKTHAAINYSDENNSFEKFKESCDKVLERRNKNIHPRSAALLNDRAARAVSLLSRHPEIKAQYPFESSLVDSFSIIKKQFAAHWAKKEVAYEQKMIAVA